MKQKDPSTKPQGRSKYQRKKTARKAFARRLGVADAPMPILLDIEREQQDTIARRADAT